MDTTCLCNPTVAEALQLCVNCGDNMDPSSAQAIAEEVASAPPSLYPTYTYRHQRVEYNSYCGPLGSTLTGVAGTSPAVATAAVVTEPAVIGAGQVNAVGAGVLATLFAAVVAML